MIKCLSRSEDSSILKKGKIFALGLDVYNGEPDIHSDYLTLPNVYVLPHLGSATKETRTAMANLAIDNIQEFFKTGDCKNKVNWLGWSNFQWFSTL